MWTLTRANTRTLIHFTGNRLGAQSEKWRRCCGEYCMVFLKAGSSTGSRKTARTYGFQLPLVPTAKSQNITHTRTDTAGKRPISFRSCFSPVCPLHCSSPLLLMIFLIPRKETEVKGRPLISSLWTWSSCGCCCLRPCPLKLAHTRTHTLTCKLTNADILLLPRTVGQDIRSFGSV